MQSQGGGGGKDEKRRFDSTYETYQAQSMGGNLQQAFIVHRHFLKWRDTRISGHVYSLLNPINHFSILQPLGGCGNRVKVSTTSQIAGCRVATNAGFFNTRTSACLGNIISQGSVIQNTGLQNGM
jgi:hypothetical protein